MSEYSRRMWAHPGGDAADRLGVAEHGVTGACREAVRVVAVEDLLVGLRVRAAGLPARLACHLELLAEECLPPGDG